MTAIISSIFNKPVFGPLDRRAADKRKAVQGFSQLLATILAKQMRQSLTGGDQGPLGIGGGASGDIYGAFFDQAMGKALAGSKAMNPLNQMIERELDGPRRPASSSGSGIAEPARIGGDRLAEVEKAMLLNETRDDLAIPPAATAMPHFEPEPSLPRDSQGPLLLPPAPSSAAPVLLPPSSLEE